jgi:ABC-type glycerol-3-phosphate transport system substrate-binding protein
MHNRTLLFILSVAVALLIIPMAGCSHSASPQVSARPSEAPSSTASTESNTTATTQGQVYPQPISSASSQATSNTYPQPVETASSQPTSETYPQPAVTSPATQVNVENTRVPTANDTNTPQATSTASPSPQPTATETIASLPEDTLAESDTDSYPGPQTDETQDYASLQTYEALGYPGPEITNTSSAQTTESATAGATVTQSNATSASATPAVTPAPGTASPTQRPTLISGTPATSPTELPPRPPLTPPPPGSNVTIWYSWNNAERDVLQTIISSFQKLNPDVTFTMQYLPMDELLTSYQEAAYRGQGPSLLLGPARWGPQLYDEQLISDLSAYVPANYLSNINPAALDSGRYQAALISLPLSVQGVVMFRNSDIISTTPQTFDELTELSQAATHGGVVGSYLERGAFFSSANIIGLGGSLMSNNGLPAFDNASGLEWLGLLRDYDEAGAVTLNTNYDLNMFRNGRVGLIMDGTWNIEILKQALGEEKLAIDPWPSYGSGHLSGWVDADSILLNANVSGDDRYATLAFMGYLLDPDVQMRLAEVGHIPSVMTTKPRDRLILQAMAALSKGAAYPTAVDNSIFNLYMDELNAAIREVFSGGVKPAEALKEASEEISQILLKSTPTP